MSANTTDEDRGISHSQEIRLGMVMYGGVSLAIYIFGVAQEFFRAVRGRRVYRLLKDFTDSDITVDIVSGTSAGGVNGILLAYALANNREFSACNTIWRDAGDIARLIRDPRTPADQAVSVLDSEYYQQRLRAGIADMPLIADSNESPSPVKELDLFITGTDVDGKVYTWFDDEGHTVDVKDHRAVFLLKHRAGRKQPFDPAATTHDALAKLARITSCFPVAFRPVCVGGNLSEAAVDALLQEWGALDPERVQFFLDGGVLDNKPFTHTVREIFFRLADRQVNRKLFYVEPDPERFAGLGRREPREPSVVEAALKSLMTIPSYESISEDLKLLAERNEKLRRYDRLVRSLDPNSIHLSVDTDAYIRCVRAREQGLELPEERGQGCLYARTRLLELSERVVRGVLRERRHEVQLTGDRRKAAERLFHSFDAWPKSSEETLYNFDIYFRIRRLFHVLYRVEPPPPGSDTSSDARRHCAYVIGRQIEALEILQVGIERMLGEIPFRWEDRAPAELWDEVEVALQILLDAKGLLPPDYPLQWRDADPGTDWIDQQALTALHKELWARADRIAADIAAERRLIPPSDFHSVFVDTDAVEQRMLARLSSATTGDLHGTYRAFIRLDAQLFPLEVFGELREKDVIETVRISPFDAQRGFSRSSGPDKVSGDVLHHFGGFLKRSWRSNDILWGRLDGLCQLIETLFTPLRLREVLTSDVAGMLRTRLADATYLDSVVPLATAAERREIETTLRRMLTEPLPSYEPSNADEFVAAFRQQFGFDSFLETLISAAQREVLEEEVPRVVRDAVQQQAEWNQYRFTPEAKAAAIANQSVGFDPRCQSLYRTGPGDFDPLVIAAASEQLALQTASQPGASAELFRKGYRVGSESVEKDIPALVLMETTGKALLSLRAAVLGSVSPEFGERIKGSAANRWLGFFLWSFYGFSGFMRRSGSGAKFVLLGAGILALLALAVGIKWWTPIVYSQDGVSLLGLLLFIITPSLILGAELFWFWGRATGLLRFGALAAGFALVGGITALAWRGIASVVCRACGAS